MLGALVCSKTLRSCTCTSNSFKLIPNVQASSYYLYRSVYIIHLPSTASCFCKAPKGFKNLRVKNGRYYLFICQTNHEARPGKATRNPAREKEVLKNKFFCCCIFLFLYFNENAYGLWLDEISSVKIPSAREAVRISNRNSSPFVRYSHSGGQKEIITAVMPVFHNVSFFHRQTRDRERQTDRQWTDRDRQTDWQRERVTPTSSAPLHAEARINRNTTTTTTPTLFVGTLSCLNCSLGCYFIESVSLQKLAGTDYPSVKTTY